MSRIKKHIKTIGIYICIIATLFTSLPVETNAEKSTTEQEDDYRIVVSLGDSFSSGEGIEKFYGQDLPLAAKVKNEDWLAHRSTQSWPGRLVIPNVRKMPERIAKYFENEEQESGENNKYWYFEAVSGATTNDIAKALDEDEEPTKGQKKEYSKSEYVGWERTTLTTEYRAIPMETYSDTVYMSYQIEVFEELKKENKKADYVTMTLGGNDAEFAKIITDAVAWNVVNPNALKNRLKKVIKNADVICAKLQKTYELIAKEAGNQAAIIVAGYPELLNPKGSGMAFSEEEAREINSAVRLFNKKIKQTVYVCALSGLNIHFVSVEEGFDNHGAYAEEPYINKVEFGTYEQDLTDLGISSAYSMHPNSKGAEVYAACVQRKINELEGMDVTALSTDFQIIVFNSEKERCSGYKVSVVGKKYAALWGNKDSVKEEYYQEIVVESENFTMNLPEGEYTITVWLEDGSYSRDVEVQKESKEKQLIFQLDSSKQQDSSGDSSTISEIPEDNETPETVETEKRQTSEERDIVLTLDISGSMSGTPMDETKKASVNFVNTILMEDASIGCVAYDDYAYIGSDFSMDAESLENIVNGLGAGGGTNIEAGLQKASEMLDYSNAKKKFIILMSDGEPNSGKEGTELIEYANTLKDKGIYIYTIGFFEYLGGGKSAAQSLMEAIASDGCHYEVSSAEELVFFFEDIADQIDGQKYVYVRIACPVDVTVSHDGETLCSSENALNTRTGFGTLTFEENAEDANEGSDNRVKILRLKDGVDYKIQIEGNGNGYMNYIIGFMDEEGEYSDLRKFNHIKIKRRTVIDTVTDADSDTVLNVDEDGDGKYDLKYKAESNGRGELIDYTYLYYIGIGAVASVTLLIIIFKIKNKITKERGKK